MKTVVNISKCFVTQVLRGWRECSNAYVIAEHESRSRLRVGGGRGHDDKYDEGRKLSTWAMVTN